MYGPRRVNFSGRRTPMQMGTPMEMSVPPPDPMATPMGTPMGTPISVPPETAGPNGATETNDGYFSYNRQGSWTQPQIMLDPVEEMERDLFNMDNMDNMVVPQMPPAQHPMSVEQMQQVEDMRQMHQLHRQQQIHQPQMPHVAVPRLSPAPPQIPSNHLGQVPVPPQMQSMPRQMGPIPHTNGHAAHLAHHPVPSPVPQVSPPPIAQLTPGSQYQLAVKEEAEPFQKQPDENRFWIAELQRCRVRYKPKSSIPPDLSSANYAAQCIAAAESSRLPPFYLSLGEYNHLRTKLPRIHVTTYLNIRNGILRLWLANPLVAVTLVEAAGCCKDARYYGLAEFAFEWLTRNGYINHGCCSHHITPPVPLMSARRRKPRQTYVIIGAGIAGLSCARQLESLLDRYSPKILAEYDDLPRVIVLEGRKRIGGRVYSPYLSSAKGVSVDLGGDTILGFGRGNPLGVVMRRQLGIPVVALDTTSDENVLYDAETGDPIDPLVDYRAYEMFKHLLDRMRTFEMGLGAMGQPSSVAAPGNKLLIRAGQDPTVGTRDPNEQLTVAQYEEDKLRPYTQPPSDDSDNTEGQPEVKVELDFLKSLGFTTKRDKADDATQIRVHAEAASNQSSASLGLTMHKFVQHLATLTDLSDKDIQALEWYFSKFEYFVGDDIATAGLSSWSHHRRNRFTGRHAWARDGMSTLAKGLDTVPTKLDVRFKTVVTVIEYEDDSAQITLENGEQVAADRVVVTTPLGCLKRRTMQFIPDLPQWKSDSIDRLVFGVVNKVVLVFDKPFWDAKVPPLIRVANKADAKRGYCFTFQNHSRRQELGGKALVVGLVSGAAAKEMAEKNDNEVVDAAVEKLRRIFKAHPDVQSAKLIESVVTRWQTDRFAKGAFSHVGVDGTTTDHDLLGRPVQRSLFFAGEATSRAYPGTVHGAYLSGLRAAKEVMNSLVGSIEVFDNLTGEEQQPELDIPAAPMPMVPVPQQQQQQQLHQSSSSRTSRTISPHLDGTRARHSPEALEPIDPPELEAELADLQRRRVALEQEQLERDLMHELGEQPTKPERHGTTNPFLLFQKDYWDICRQETEAAKRKDKKGANVHATRNEIRASLGKKWRSLPEEERAPYVELSNQAKVDNEERQEAYARKLKWFETEAANFRQQWKQDHPSVPSLREIQLEEQLSSYRPRKKRTRLTE